jgi:hypothetical protein
MINAGCSPKSSLKSGGFRERSGAPGSEKESSRGQRGRRAGETGCSVSGRRQLLCGRAAERAGAHQQGPDELATIASVKEAIRGYYIAAGYAARRPAGACSGEPPG